MRSTTLPVWRAKEQQNLGRGGSGLIAFPDRYDTRREAADSADARQGEATKCRIDMEMG